MCISTDGPGIVFYSEEINSSVDEEFDFFSNDFYTPEQVSKHVKKGDITCVGTGTSGNFLLSFLEGYPSKSICDEYPSTVRLAIKITNNKMYFDDVFSLFEWSKNHSRDLTVELENGFYHLTLLTKLPSTRKWGDNQEILIFVKKINKMPQLMWEGVPSFH